MSGYREYGWHTAFIKTKKQFLIGIDFTVDSQTGKRESYAAVYLGWWTLICGKFYLTLY